MEIITYVLLGISLFIFLLSLFQKDPYKELKEEIDHLTLQHVQELYQVKKKLKILEEELLISNDQLSESAVTDNDREIHDIIKNQVLALAQQGKPIEQIAVQSSLTIEDVFAILREYKDKEWVNE
jgi:hypothetical protein